VKSSQNVMSTISTTVYLPLPFSITQPETDIHFTIPVPQREVG